MCLFSYRVIIEVLKLQERNFMDIDQATSLLLHCVTVSMFWRIHCERVHYSQLLATYQSLIFMCRQLLILINQLLYCTQNAQLRIGPLVSHLQLKWGRQLVVQREQVVSKALPSITFCTCRFSVAATVSNQHPHVQHPSWAKSGLTPIYY